MKIDAKDSEAYLAEWRKSDPLDISGSSEEVAKSHAEKIEKEYNNNKLKELIANNGWK